MKIEQLKELWTTYTKSTHNTLPVILNQIIEDYRNNRNRYSKNKFYVYEICKDVIKLRTTHQKDFDLWNKKIMEDLKI